MKKALSLFLVLLILVGAAFPVSAFAQDINGDQGMFEVPVSIGADAYMLVSLDNGNVLAQKNKDKKKYPASLTKIVTAMVTIENVADLESTATVSQHAVDVLEGTGAQVAGLQAGDSVSFKKLLYLTMVYSACDACQVLAEAVGGSEAGFVKLMNEWAAKCGCKGTHFVNPDGLHDDEHYTTPADMMLMTLAALKNSTFNEVSTAKKCDYNGTEFLNTNYLLNQSDASYYYEYASGIKTGTTTQAGNCVITKAQKGEMNYLAIVMDSPMIAVGGEELKGSFVDAKALFEWGFHDLKQQQIYASSQSVGTLPVLYGKKCDAVKMNVESDIQALAPVGLNSSDITIQPLELPESIEAPVKQGDVICKANVLYKDKIIAKTTLVAASDVRFSLGAKISASVKAGFAKRPFLNILCLVLVLLILALLIRILHVQRIKKKRAAARAERRQQNYNNK